MISVCFVLHQCSKSQRSYTVFTDGTKSVMNYEWRRTQLNSYELKVKTKQKQALACLPQSNMFGTYILIIFIVIFALHLHGARMFTAYPMGHSIQKQLSNGMRSPGALNSQHVEGRLCKGQLKMSLYCNFNTK